MEIQIARYIAMLANGGNPIDVTIVKEITDQDGTVIDKETIKNELNEKLGITNDDKEQLNINKENIDVVLEGMRSVTTETRRNSL